MGHGRKGNVRYAVRAGLFAPLVHPRHAREGGGLERGGTHVRVDVDDP